MNTVKKKQTESAEVPEVSALEWAFVNGHKEESSYIDQYSTLDAGSYLQGLTIRGQSVLSLDQNDFSNSPSCSWWWRPIFSGDILQRAPIYISNIAGENRVCFLICHSCRSGTDVFLPLTASPAPCLLISCTCTSFANLHQYLCSGLWLTQCQIVFCVMQDFPEFCLLLDSPWSTQPVADPPLQPVVQITCWLSVSNHKTLDFTWMWTHNQDYSFNEELCVLDLLCRIVVRTTGHFHPATGFCFF